MIRCSNDNQSLVVVFLLVLFDADNSQTQPGLSRRRRRSRNVATKANPGLPALLVRYTSESIPRYRPLFTAVIKNTQQPLKSAHFIFILVK